MIEILGAPYDLCGLRPGSRMGPAALRMAGLAEALRGLVGDVVDGGDVTVVGTSTEPDGLRSFSSFFELVSGLRTMAITSLQGGRVPVLLGGDHSIAVSGVSAALEVFQGDVALLWIDAHADINTPATSSTGNVHGMPVAALQGIASGVGGAADRDWRRLLAVLGEPRLQPEATSWLGLRDVDFHEKPLVRSGLGITMTDIDRMGMATCVGQIDDFIRASGAKNLWVSFDVDVLDPVLAPGTGTAVRGGLTYREAHLLAELLSEKTQEGHYRLAGLDIVETNPLVDSENSTAKIAVEWALSLFGKTIL
jgi:arginase